MQSDSNVIDFKFIDKGFDKGLQWIDIIFTAGLKLSKYMQSIFHWRGDFMSSHQWKTLSQWLLTFSYFSALPFAMQKHINGIMKWAGTKYFAGVYKEDFVGIFDGIQAVSYDYTCGCCR